MEPLINPMPTASHPQGREPVAITLPTNRGWDADHVDSADIQVQVSQMLNMRKQPWGYETRSGFKAWNFTADPAKTPIWKIAFRLNDVVLIDVTFYYTASTGVIGAIFLNTLTSATVDKVLVTIPANLDPIPLLTAMQYESFIIFSVPGFFTNAGTYRVSPTDVACTAWDNPVILGKQVCPTPIFVSFAEKIQGDLYVYDAGKRDNDHPDVLAKNLFYDPGQKRARTIRLPINVDYFLVMGAAEDAWKIEGYPWYERDPNDVVPDPGSKTSPQDSQHNPTRAYGYRFVPVQTFKDVNGQEYTYRGAPSTDLWVPNVNYAPPQPIPVWQRTDLLGDDGLQAAESYLHNHWLDPNSTLKTNANRELPTTISAKEVWKMGRFTGVGHDNDEGSLAPTDSDFFRMVKKVREFLQDRYTRPYNFLAYFLGFRSIYWSDTTPSENDLMDFGRGNTPWFTQQPFVPFMSAAELRHAPFTEFHWSDFAGLPADTSEVEIYRTAYCPPLSKDIEEQSPLFAPHKYGYVGSLKKDGTFTDDVTDESLDFESQNPERFNGVLAGNFSGAVIREHDDRVVLGDIYTRTQLIAPAQVARRCVADSVSINGSHRLWANVAAPDPLGVYDDSWQAVRADNVTDGIYLQYVDRYGRKSDLTRLDLDVIQHDGATYSYWITIPRGYAPSITGVRIIRSQYDTSAGARRYYLLSELPVTQTNYKSDGTDAGGLAFPENAAKTAARLSAVDLTATLTEHHDPGWIAWSDPEDIMQWPVGNRERHHQFAPVRNMSMVLGPLYVYTDMSVTKTDLQGRFEHDHQILGCLGRGALAKYEKIDLFLSQDGLCLSEGSSQRFVRGDIHSEVLKYLREQIPNQPALANARRATVSLLGRGRQEVWLRFPSSVDLGGTLPARIFIYREFEFSGLQSVQNYEFELSANSADNSIDPQGVVYFASHSDGRLFSSHVSPLDSKTLIVQDNDTDDPWVGLSALELRCPLNSPTVAKVMDRLVWWAESHAAVRIMTGVQRADGLRDRTTGMVSKKARIFNVNTLAQNNDQGVIHPIKAIGVESTARVPIIRFVTTPNKDGEHMFRLRSMRLHVVPFGPSNNR